MEAKRLIQNVLRELSGGLLWIQESYITCISGGLPVHKHTLSVVDNYGYIYAEFNHSLFDSSGAINSAHISEMIADSNYSVVQKWMIAGKTNESINFYSLEDSIKIAKFIKNSKKNENKLNNHYYWTVCPSSFNKEW